MKVQRISKGEREAFRLGVREVIEFRPLVRAAKSLIKNGKLDTRSGLEIARRKNSGGGRHERQAS